MRYATSRVRRGRSRPPDSCCRPRGGAAGGLRGRPQHRRRLRRPADLGVAGRSPGGPTGGGRAAQADDGAGADPHPGGEGPFLFALDTGASSSTIDDDLADRLGLPRTGERQPVSVIIGQDRGAGGEGDRVACRGRRLVRHRGDGHRPRIARRRPSPARAAGLGRAQRVRSGHHRRGVPVGFSASLSFLGLGVPPGTRRGESPRNRPSTTTRSRRGCSRSPAARRC